MYIRQYLLKQKYTKLKTVKPTIGITCNNRPGFFLKKTLELMFPKLKGGEIKIEAPKK